MRRFDRLLTLLLRHPRSRPFRYRPSAARAAEHAAAVIGSLGMKAFNAPDAGHDGCGHAQDTARGQLLFYGHYDVQPLNSAEPLGARPLIRNRGFTPAGSRSSGAGRRATTRAVDDPCRGPAALDRRLPWQITVAGYRVSGGGGGMGSPSLMPFLHENAVMNCDRISRLDLRYRHCLIPKTPAITPCCAG